MTSKSPTEDPESSIPTVRYNAEAYRRKLERQLMEEQPITQRAVPRQ